MSTMSEEIILLVERAGGKKKEETFGAALERKGFKVVVAQTGRQALDFAERVGPALIVLNAASLGTNGLRICRLIRASHSEVPVIHILPKGEKAALESSPAEALLELPFTPRKLINSIKRLLPGARKEVTQVGPIRLALDARIVQAYGREQRLTPKTASLLEVFLRHPGETLDRSFLMRQVWDTDYVGDTRTLDVHVRWMREAIEPDPRSPRHILTVRGVGYRFEPGE
jgi:DNA-binding response OmpR family regulator